MGVAHSTPDPVSAHNFPVSGAALGRAMSNDPGAARRALRSATQEVHQRLHRHPGLARLAAGTIGRDEYTRLLARSFGFHAMAEPLVGLSGARTACLSRDLTALGLSAAEIAALPRCPPLQIAPAQAELIGAHYVLIGASLGGKVMARAVAERNPADALPVEFLTELGEDEWKTFAAALEDRLPDGCARTRAATAARATFAAYEDWMTWDE